jgi:hypothetical protein
LADDTGNPMSKSEFIALFVRLAGIVLLVTGIGGLTATVWAIANLTEGSLAAEIATAWGAVLSQIAWALAGLAFITFPHVVASWFAGRHAEQPLAFALTRDDITAIGFVLLGLWCIIEAFRDIAYVIASHYTNEALYRSAGLAPPPYDRHEIGVLISDAVVFLIGLWLLLGAVGLRRLLTWARNAAAPPKNPETGDS